MKSANPQFGLVLTGGGAKGAYQVGALKYLAEIGFKPHIIAGSSIGALNSAILSAYRPFRNAVQRLDELWDRLAEIKPLRINVLTGSRYAAKFFAPSVAPGVDLLYESLLHLMSSWQLLPDSVALLDPVPLEVYVRQAIVPSELRKGTELWVTAFPCVNVCGIEFNTFFEFIRTRIGVETHWLCVNDFKDDEAIYNLLLASAALPWVFPRRKVGNTTYIDGGLVDNVPLKPLVERGCNYVVVIHLQNGSVWDRNQFPNQKIIEIRPQKLLNKSDTSIVGMVSTFLDFSAKRITQLKQCGYEDAKYCMEPILRTIEAINRQHEGIDSLINSTNSLINSTKQIINDEPLS
ncbi:MAG: patatin-like phospholipase family protein [Scytonematopsis contorta HA4267-MV1]|jgi:NTE family protein|nr:patatin-like phospholipase family protein [Scytonematopsis contorta HA4267-MV1]